MSTALAEKHYPVPRALAPKWVSRTFSLAMNGMVFGQLQYFGTQKLGLDVGIIGTLFLEDEILRRLEARYALKKAG